MLEKSASFSTNFLVTLTKFLLPFCLEVMVAVLITCSFCKKKFFDRNTSKMTQHAVAYESCKQHELDCSSRSKPSFTCPICAESFPVKSKLERHTNNKHGTETKKCPVCKKSVRVGHNQELYKKHLGGHRPKTSQVRPSVARRTESQKQSVIKIASELSPAEREEYLRSSRVSETQLERWTACANNKRRKLDSRSSGAGVRGPEKLVITPSMHEALKHLLRTTRGPPPQKHSLYDEEREREYLEDNGHRTGVTIDDLTNHIWCDSRFDAEFKKQEKKSNRKEFKLTREVVNTRVKRWCKKNGVKVKNASAKLKTKKETVVAQRCLGTLKKVDQLQTEKGPATLTFCSLDETAMRVLALSLQTLCYEGGDCKVDAEQHSKFTMSLVCLYYSETGEVEFVVMCGGGSKEVQWEQHGDVWFLITTTKWMRKHSYKEVLNFGLSKRAIDCLLDDLASGHHGTNGNNILKQLFPNARRIRIQGCCTPHIQVADTVWANFRLNKLVTDKMRKDRIKELLETGKITYLLGNSLTATGREFLGNFLSGIKEDWNTNEKLTE